MFDHYLFYASEKETVGNKTSNIENETSNVCQ